MAEDNPFTAYDFLHALESSGSVCAETGWQAMHLTMHRQTQVDDSDSELVAMMPLYLKTHSYGEYVFDWAWAEAYERHQLDYYPKLVSAVPFTPISGTRLGLSETLTAEDKLQLVRQLTDFLAQTLQALAGSSWHILFHHKQEQQLFQQVGHLTRLGTQFHWFNRDYQHFDDFLASMSSRKRKNIAKERRQLQEKNLNFRFIEGSDISEFDLQHFYRCYQTTYLKRSGHGGYLNIAFFRELIETMASSVRLLIVDQISEEGALPIAAALYFVTQQTLYGRYWGCLMEIEGLHFETCYYQGIEYAIAQGLKKFDAGAQGEHKVLRGFEPIETYSAHEVLHQGFREAIAAFTEQENVQIHSYMAQLKQILPYKKLANDN
nr:GNAT family N-acetyltransferase [Shewanella sp. Isolate11]